jgi:hypothetical protein
VSAGGSATFQVAGATGLPAQGVVEVAEHIVVTSPAQSGYLDAYRGGGTDPDHATLNFVADDGADVGYQDSILSSISPTGQETVTNHSSGSIDVQVAVVGLFFDPQVPPAPAYLQTGDTDTTTPELTGIVQDVTGDDLNGEIFLFRPIGIPSRRSMQIKNELLPLSVTRAEIRRAARSFVLFLAGQHRDCRWQSGGRHREMLHADDQDNVIPVVFEKPDHHRSLAVALDIGH